MALLLADLGVTKTHSRPARLQRQSVLRSAVQDAEVLSRSFPSASARSRTAARSGRASSRWYNHEHHHSGLGLPHARRRPLRPGRRRSARSGRRCSPPPTRRIPSASSTDGRNRPICRPPVWINPPAEKSDRSGCPRNDDRHVRTTCGSTRFRARQSRCRSWRSRCDVTRYSKRFTLGVSKSLTASATRWEPWSSTLSKRNVWSCPVA